MSAAKELFKTITHVTQITKSLHDQYIVISDLMDEVEYDTLEWMQCEEFRKALDRVMHSMITNTTDLLEAYNDLVNHPANTQQISPESEED